VHTCSVAVESKPDSRLPFGSESDVEPNVLGDHCDFVDREGRGISLQHNIGSFSGTAEQALSGEVYLTGK
jgi:hypothetical protein